MLNISDIIEGRDPGEVGAAIYYVLRFLKQAASATARGKDIFQDDSRSAPSAATKALSLAIVQRIEESSGKKIAELNEPEMRAIYSYLSDVVFIAEGDFSEDEIEAAQAVVKEISGSSF